MTTKTVGKSGKPEKDKVKKVGKSNKIAPESNKEGTKSAERIQISELGEETPAREPSAVESILFNRLMEKIEAGKKLPWMKPFQGASMNWFSKTEYHGLNKILLDPGEYITPNQIKTYNEKTKGDYWFTKGDPYEIVCFYKKRVKPLDAETHAMISKGVIPSKILGKLVKNEDGSFGIATFVLQYYNVYNIKYVKSKATGESLPSRLGETIFEKYVPAEEIIEAYTHESGVRVSNENTHGKAFYEDTFDTVHLMQPKFFVTTEAYYRTLFHELIHSTGIKSRLNRECFKIYKGNDRSREELIAEVGSLLLASEAGFRAEGSFEVDNSFEYIASWCDWMRKHKHEVILGFAQANKAKKYIMDALSGHNDVIASADGDED